MQVNRPGPFALLALVAGLAGCTLAPGTGSTPAATTARPDAAPPTRMAVASGAVVVASPRGFCIDRDASSDRDGGAALVVLSPCQALGAGLFGPRPAHPALLTAAVAPQGRATAGPVAATALAAFAVSRPGRAALSRAGKAETVTILESLTGADTFLLRIADTAPFAWGAVQPEYWRGVLTVGGRTVTVSVLAMPETPMSRDQGLALLTDFVTTMRDATAELAGRNPG